MPSMKIFEQKCFDALKNSETKAKEFEGPIGQNIITIPVRNKAQYEYCVSNGIEVFEREIRVNDGYIRHFYFFYITFEQAANIAMP